MSVVEVQDRIGRIAPEFAARGCLELRDGLYVGGFNVRKRHGALRPGKYVSDATIVALGQAIVRGEPLCLTAKQLGISRRTASRWVKRLGLK